MCRVTFRIIDCPELSAWERAHVEYTVRQYADLLLDMSDDDILEHYQRHDIVWRELENAAKKSMFSWPSPFAEKAHLALDILNDA